MNNEYCAAHGEMHGDCYKDKEANHLLPCPFCGGEAYRHIRNDILHVGCNNCLISFANHIRFGCRADSEWNNRTK